MGGRLRSAIDGPSDAVVSHRPEKINISGVSIVDFIIFTIDAFGDPVFILARCLRDGTGPSGISIVDVTIFTIDAFGDPALGLFGTALSCGAPLSWTLRRDRKFPV